MKHYFTYKTEKRRGSCPENKHNDGKLNGKVRAEKKTGSFFDWKEESISVGSSNDNDPP